jgi:putative ABC transport system permease protein
MTSLLAKVWYDLWQSKARTLQVVLVIALGGFGIGLVVGGRNLISGTIAAQWRQAEPANIKLAVNPPLTDEQLKALESIPGVHQVEGQFSSSIEYRLPGQVEWKTARLEGRQDYQAQKMELVKLVSGAWPGHNSLGVIKTADRLYGVGQGMIIEVRSNDQVRRLPIDGTLKPIGPFPVVFLGTPIFYADRQTFARLAGRDTFDIVSTRDVTFDQAQAETTDSRIQKYFKDIGVDSVGLLFPTQARIVSPEVPPAAGILNALFLILGVIGGIIIVLGIFLVYNSISATITQQVNQIGVLKAIGARTTQVLYTYVLLVLSYGLLSALVAIPLGALGARGLQSLFINLLNLEDPGFSFDLTAVAVQAAVCLAAPLLAALLPLRSGIRISVREAISSYGLGGTADLVGRLIAGVQRAPYLVLLVFGNAFRNRRRVFFIELTLVVAGAIFMMVIGVNDATRYTYGDKLQSIHNYQVTLRWENSQRAASLEAVAQSQPGITGIESWLVSPASARPAAQAKSEVTDARLTLFGLPSASQVYLPDLRQGRWLDPGDGRALVITQKLAGERGWGLGDWITLSTPKGREQQWQVVGITYDPIAGLAAFTPLASLQRAQNAAGQANSLFVQIQETSSAAQAAAASALVSAYESKKLAPEATSAFGKTTVAGIITQRAGGNSLIIQLLAIMAVVIAVVGGVGLSGVLTLNILERRREVGVMRSIGASDGQVVRLFAGEGVLLGWLSWLVALPLSIPAAYLMTTVGLSVVLNEQLVYRFSPLGALAWLAIISLLALLASALPARSAARLSVRESLAYQ